MRYGAVCWAMLLAAALTGCASAPRVAEGSREPDYSVRALCEAANYHEAMRRLPKAMVAWDEYTRRTGSTSEGAAGYLYSTTLFEIAARGDDAWGAILDDPDIPHDYKVEMIFEIAEARLGKGAAWSPYHTDVVILPRAYPAQSWSEVNVLLRRVLAEQGDDERK